MMLCTLSYRGIEASGVLYQTIVGSPRSDTLNEEANRNFNVFVEFYKFCVTALSKAKGEPRFTAEDIEKVAEGGSDYNAI